MNCPTQEKQICSARNIYVLLQLEDDEVLMCLCIGWTKIVLSVDTNKLCFIINKVPVKELHRRSRYTRSSSECIVQSTEHNVTHYITLTVRHQHSHLSFKFQSITCVQFNVSIK